MKSCYYAATAYNSHHIALQPQPQQASGILNKIATARLRRLPYTATNSSIPRWLYKEYTPSAFNAERQEKSGTFYWNQATLATATFKWPAAAFSILLGFAWFVVFPLTIVIFITAFIIFFLENMSWEKGVEFIVWYFTWVFPPGFFIWCLKYLPEYSPRVFNWIFKQVHKDYELNRQTGMVTLYDSNNKVRFSHPFIEFDAILVSTPNHQGLMSYSLALVHRYNAYSYEVPVGNLISSPLPQDYELLWNVLQQYMDIAKPLPDFLALEESRPKDPTTAAHDKQSGRAPDYWRSMSDEEYEEITDELLLQQSDSGGMPINIFKPDHQETT